MPCQWPHGGVGVAEEQEASIQSPLPQPRPAPLASPLASCLPRGSPSLPRHPPDHTHGVWRLTEGMPQGQVVPGTPVCSGDRPGVFVGISPTR